MYTDFYRASEYLSLTVVSTILFAALFLGVLVWVAVEKPQRFESVARQPLDGDPEGSEAQ